MQDILRDFIVTNTTPELAEAIETAHLAFMRIGYPNYEDGFIELLMLDDQQDTNGTMLKIINLTNEYLRNTLLQHAIVLNENATMDDASEIVNGILDLAVYENVNEIMQVIQMDVSPEEILAEALSLVTSKTVDESLAIVDSVEPALIGKIKDIMRVEDQETPIDQVQDRKYIDELKRFQEFINNHPLRVMTLLMDGMSVGWQFALYVEVIGRELEALPVRFAAYELIAMALISEDGGNNPRAVIKPVLEKYIASLESITQIDILVSDLLLQFGQTK